MAWRGVQAMLSPIFYWTSDAALFLYAFRIWVTSVDADKRSHNLYIEKFSDLTQKEKIDALKPSVINSKKVKLARKVYLFLFAIVIIFFNLMGAFFYPDEDDPKVIRKQNQQQMDVTSWIGNVKVLWWQTIVLIFFKGVILAVFLHAIWKFWKIEDQKTGSGEYLNKNKLSFTAHILLMTLWLLLQILSAWALNQIFHADNADMSYYNKWYLAISLM